MLLTNEILWFCILILVAICLIMCGLLLINKVSEMHEMKKYIDEMRKQQPKTQLQQKDIHAQLNRLIAVP